jgi:hypothetical protein
VYIYVAANSFGLLLLLLQESTEILLAITKFLNCFCVGGNCRDKTWFPTMRFTGFSSTMYANDAPRRASRWDPTTHLYHILCFVLFTALYKLFGKEQF